MTWERWTALLIVACFVLAVLYDLIAYFAGGNSATISRTVLDVSENFRGFALCLCFALGVLAGHLFLAQHQ